MPVKRKQRTREVLGSPFLARVTLDHSRADLEVHPFTIPLIAKLDLAFTAPVTFLVGENGTGKSTLLEALAWALGFNAQGGPKDNSYAEGVVVMRWAER